MKSVLKTLMKGKSNKYFNIFLLVAIAFVVGLLYTYNNKKSVVSAGMRNNPFASAGEVEMSKEAGSPPSDVQTGVNGLETTDGSNYLSVNGISSGPKASESCNNKPVMDPKELLPTDNNNEWSNIMPSTDLKNIGMLNAGHHIGINTVGSSMRNANLQIRSEPVIPQSKSVGPWNNTTIQPDNLRRPLEIGGSE
jgi:hypothetical protein